MSRRTRLLCELFIALLVVVSVLGMASRAAAQSAGTGSIVGRVTDEKGAAVAGAKVRVRNLDTNATRDVDTNGEGEFRAVLLQPGNYEVTVEQQGFSTVKRSPIHVEVGSTSAADIQLKVAGVSQTITVSEQAPITDPEKVEVTSTVTQKQIEELPINGRRWDNFVLLTPGVSMDGTFGLISYRGISGLLNNNTIDGADNNQAFFSEARGRTRAANTYSQAGVKEFQVGLSNFSAEFGRAAGGTVNAVTKSGTNQIHGEAFYFIRDDSLQAREPTLTDNSNNPLKNQDRRQQYGLVLGAPIIKDKLFFFGDWEQFHRTQTFLIRSAGNFLTTFIPTCTSGQSGNLQLAQNCNALLNFEASQGGQQPRTPINNTALGKADWVITPNHTLSGTYNWHRWQSANGVQTQQVIARGLSDNGKDIVKTDSVVARLSSVLSRNRVNQAQFQFSRDFEQQIGNSTDPRTTVTNGISFGMSEFLPRPAWPNEKRFQWTDTLSWIVGRHAFKTGGDINYVRDNSINLFNGGGAYSYSAIQSLALDCPTPTRTGSSPCVPMTLDPTPIGKHWNSYTQAFDVRGLNPPGQLFFTTTDYNVFLQDTFKWRPSVTVNAGLRYELQHMPAVEPINFNGTQLLGYPQFQESQSINQDTNNLGPRLALAWDIGGKQKNIIRVGGGVYYGRTGNALIRSHLLENGVGLPSFFFSSSQTATGPVYPSVLASQATTSGTRSVTFMAGDYVRPFISMTELAYEREIVRNISASVTYVYTRGNHLTHTADINLSAPTSAINFFLSDGTPLGSSPFYGGSRPLFDTLPGVPAGTRLGSVLRSTSDLNSTYHGVIFQLTQRARFGLTQQFHFTYSNAKDEGQAQGASPFADRFEQFYDPRNRRAEYSRSEFDTRRRLVWSYIWEPSAIWKIHSKVANSVLGDWSLSGVTTVQDGQPFSPTINGSLFGGASSIGAASCPATGTCATATGSSNGSGGSQRPGWLPRSYIQTTGFINFDMRLQKDWRLTESKRLRFIFESFNIFNRANHPNRFNFNSTGFTLSSSKACAAGSTSISCTAQNPSDLTLPRFATIALSSNYTGVLDPVRGSGDLKGCLATSCLSSASGTLFGPRDVEFALKFIF